MRFSLLCLLILGCTGNVSTLPLPEAIDAGVVGGGPPTPFAGKVLRSLCEALEGATVQVLEGEGVAGPTGVDGRFELIAPERSALLVTAPGRVPTLTFQRTFAAGSTGEQAGSVPADVSLLLHSLAGFELPAGAGTIVFAVLDAAPLPITDVEVTLLTGDGEVAPANVRRRYVTFEGTLPRILDSQGTGPNGLAAFFNVPPGRYRLRLERAGYRFTEQVVPVRGGTITLDLVRGEGSGAAPPVLFPGIVSAFPLRPSPSMQTAPLPDASVTVTLEDGTTLDARTDATGAYVVGLPRVGQWFDVTASSPGYETTRSEQACAGHFAYQHFTLEDSFYFDRFRRYALGARATVPDAGTVFLSVAQGTTALTGVRLRLEPPSAVPFYGQDVYAPVSCVRGTCDDAGVCGDGTRCQDGQCVVGSSGTGLCQPCDTAACPAGYAQSRLVSEDGGRSCFCLPTSGSCTEAAPVCEEGTYCWHFTGVDAGLLSVTTSACLLYTARFAATGQNGGVAHPVMYANVPEGLYTLSASLDGGVLGEPSRLRVGAGVTNNFKVP